MVRDSGTDGRVFYVESSSDHQSQVSIQELNQQNQNIRILAWLYLVRTLWAIHKRRLVADHRLPSYIKQSKLKKKLTIDLYIHFTGLSRQKLRPFNHSTTVTIRKIRVIFIISWYRGKKSTRISASVSTLTPLTPLTQN